MLEIEVSGLSRGKVFTKAAPNLITPKDIYRVLRYAASKIRQALIDATPVGVLAGSHAKDAWTPVKKIEGGYSFFNPKVYAAVLEYGSKAGNKPWPSIGPRTEEYRDRIYSSQAIGGITKKANLEDVAEKAIQEKLKEVLE